MFRHQYTSFKVPTTCFGTKAPCTGSLSTTKDRTSITLVNSLWIASCCRNLIWSVFHDLLYCILINIFCWLKICNTFSGLWQPISWWCTSRTALRSTQPLVQGDQKVSVHPMITKHVFLASLLGSICLAADRQGQGDTRLTLSPSVIPNSNYVIMVRDWNCLKHIYVFLYCNHQAHCNFLIALYNKYRSLS
jgi:hypothetical protein